MHIVLKAGLRGVATLFIAGFLVACNGKSDTVPSTPVPPSSSVHTNPPPAVTPPTVTPSEAPPPPATDPMPAIAGTPPTKAVIGELFNFQPSASDTSGSKLTFAVSGKPTWASFDGTSGHLWGTPNQKDLGAREQIQISVSDGIHVHALPKFALTVVLPRKSTYGHYFATHYSDTPKDAAMLCEQAGVSGVVWRQTWNQVEPSQGTFDFDSFDKVLSAIAASKNPHCQLWLFVEFKRA